VAAVSAVLFLSGYHAEYLLSILLYSMYTWIINAQNDISICPAHSAGLTAVTNRQTHADTDRQTMLHEYLY